MTPPNRAHARPQRGFPAHDGGSTTRCQNALQSTDAWLRAPPAEPAWWRYCRGKSGAWLLVFYLLSGKWPTRRVLFKARFGGVKRLQKNVWQIQNATTEAEAR